MKRRFDRLRRKWKLALAGLVGGFAVACAPNPPGEAPPLAPRPEPVSPLPSSEDPSPPVPGSPDPMSPKFPPEDAGAPGAPPPVTAPGFVDDRPLRMQATDAGASDATSLPPVPDSGVPADAPAQPVSDAR